LCFLWPNAISSRASSPPALGAGNLANRTLEKSRGKTRD
jgi:hypothetical protein